MILGLENILTLVVCAHFQGFECDIAAQLFLAASSSSRSLVVSPSEDFVKKLTLLGYKRKSLYFTIIEVTVVTVMTVMTKIIVQPQTFFTKKLFHQNKIFTKKKPQKKVPT